MSIKRVVIVAVVLMLTVISAGAQSSPEDLRRTPKRDRYIFPVAPRAGVIRAAPPNDSFANATVVNSTLPYVDTVLDFDQATGEPGEPEGCLNAGEDIASIWYSFTPTANMAVTFDTQGSDFDTVLGVYTGASVGALTELRCNDDFDLVEDAGWMSMIVSLNVTANETYIIRVAAYDSTELLGGESATLTIKPTPAAGDFAVNTTTDAVDFNIGDGLCDTEPNPDIQQCTLRAAINEANASQPGSTIALPAGSYALTVPTLDEGAGISGDLDIISEVIITGVGPQSTVVDGSALDGVFEFFTGANVTMTGVKVRNGFAGAGGGVRLNETAVVTLDNVWIADNRATSGGGGVTVEGGTLTMTNSAITGNVATGGSTVSGNGGGLEVRDEAEYNVAINLTNVTISGNTAVTPASLDQTVCQAPPSGSYLIAAKGGGVYFGPTLGNTLTATFNNVTLAANNAWCGGGIFTDTGVVVTTRNTLIGDNVANSNKDCSGNIGSQGSNVIGNATGCTTAGSDVANVDVRLNPLYVNAPGNTPTHLLRAASPARNAANTSGCMSKDQRGIDRSPVNGTCDIGALEALTVVPGAFALISPAHNFVVPSATSLTQFTWQQSANALSYAITLDSLTNGTSANVFTTAVTAAAACSASVCTASFANPLPDGFYRYTVTAYADTNATVAASSHIVQVDSVAGLPNLLTNGGFETKSVNGQALKWNAKGISGDKRKCNTDTVTYSYKENCAYRFKGTKLENSSIRQRLDLNGLVMEKNKSFRFSFYANYSASIKATVMMKVIYKKTSITPSKFKLVLPAGDQTWMPLSGEVILKNPKVDRVILILKHTAKSGTWLVDDVRAVYLNGTTTARQDAVSTRDAQNGGLLPPPAAPDGFRGNN